MNQEERIRAIEALTKLLDSIGHSNATLRLTIETKLNEIVSRL